jgi:hypothetical protein
MADRVSRVVLPAAALGLAFLIATFDPTTTWWFPSCPMHALTGWLCPLCGSLRAVHALLRGAPVEAFRFNPLTTVALPALLVMPAQTRLRALDACVSLSGAAFALLFTIARNVSF